MDQNIVIPLIYASGFTLAVIAYTVLSHKLKSFWFYILIFLSLFCITFFIKNSSLFAEEDCLRGPCISYENIFDSENEYTVSSYYIFYESAFNPIETVKGSMTNSQNGIFCYESACKIKDKLEECEYHYEMANLC